MPYKPNKPCLYSGCVNTVPHGYCTTHAYLTPSYRPIDTRPSAAARGYDSSWKKIRADVLINFGIPEDQWGLYDVHHIPEYNPDIEPDHRAYKLTPVLHNEHSKITGKQKYNSSGGRG
jgi:hypothetical protein